MAELRQNMVTKEWVIIADERAKRPDEFVQSKDHLLTEAQDIYDPDCPFCPGNEELDLEIECFPNNEHWQTRAVYNKYPALTKDSKLIRRTGGMHRKISGVGHHEILVESRQHNTTLALMSPEEIRAVLETLYSRGWGIRKDTRIEQVVYFKNHGAPAGASLKHPHSQIIGLPVVPSDIRHKIDEVRRYFDDTGHCAYCTMMKTELRSKKRLIAVSEHFIAFVLYAAPTPFYTWIIPRKHSVSFLYSQPDELDDLAHILQDVLRRLYIGLYDPAYNLIIRTAPVKEISNDYLHWHVTIIPRLSRTAGFELGSGIYINTAIPEQSATFLRNIKV